MSSAENPIQTRGKNDASATGQATDERLQDCSAGWTVTDWLMLLSVTVIALIIRLVYNHQLQSSPFFANPSLDAKLHVDWAIAITENRSLFEGVYARAPLYPWLLGGLYSLTGVDYFIPRVISAIVGSISCGLLFAISRRAFGR
ncbi:MAG: glycosyltransferase family 39 protein [Planctomycetes bacterium]|nr:glycosyltransferase family 39 protein [Planctomycetota bacterium]